MKEKTAESTEVKESAEKKSHLQGMWTNIAITPLERPAEFAGKPFLTKAEYENLKLIERFTRANPDTITYEFTVSDPTAYMEPRSAHIPMKRTEEPIFEYACHEGNYALTGVLAGARADEKKIEKGER